MADQSARLALVVATGMDEYQTRLLAGILPVLQPEGIAVVTYLNGPLGPGLPRALLELLEGALPDGVIVTNVETEEDERALVGRLGALGIPAVLIGATSPQVTSIRGDNVTGMRALMRHLLDERGVRRPVLARGIPHQVDSVLREGVFREELAARGVPVDEELVIDGHFWNDTTYRAMWALLKHRRDMDAVVALNDLSALGAIGALHRAELRVPDDVLVTGFDNEQVASLSWPGLTTVDQDLEQQGETAARRLLAEMDGAEPGGGIVVPSHLVVRASTAPPDWGGAEQVATAIGMAKAAQTRLAAQDAVIGLNRAMMRSRTLEQVVEALLASLDWMGIERCFLAIREDAPGRPGWHQAQSRQPAPRPDGAAPVRLVLAYRDGRPLPPPADVFPTHRLLPDTLRAELARGVLAMQPLAAGDREYGFLLFERSPQPMTVSEVMHTDLTRTLEAVFSTEELEQHAATLEDTIARRTRELRTEVVTRRRAEQDLQAEVATRRRAERELQRANAELRRMVMQDGLTMIASRAALEEHLDLHLHDTRRVGHDIALLMVDVDLFKAYNDRYGHVMGDETLRAVARCLQQSVLNPQDLAARYGGEEFVVVLPQGGLRAALAVAARFRRLLAEAAIPHEASDVASVVTASVGIEVVPRHERADPAILFRAADAALYRAKALGRDRVVVAGSEREVPTEAPTLPRPRATAPDRAPAG